MRKSTLAMASALSAAVTLTAPAATAVPAVDIYSGAWDTGYRCDREEVDLAGQWRIVLKPDGTATMTLNVFFEDGEEAGHHASWGYGKFVQQTKGLGETFNISWWQTRFVLVGEDLTYTINDFDCDPREGAEFVDLQQLTLEGTAH